MKFFLKRLHNKKGFTLIELIVVIAILAILALIAIPRFAGFTEKAKMADDEQYAAILATAALVKIASDQMTGAPSLAALISDNLVSTYSLKAASYIDGDYGITYDDDEGTVTVTITGGDVAFDITK